MKVEPGVYKTLEGGTAIVTATADGYALGQVNGRGAVWDLSGWLQLPEEHLIIGPDVWRLVERLPEAEVVEAAPPPVDDDRPPAAPSYYEGAVEGLACEAAQLTRALGPLGFDARHDDPLRLGQWRMLLTDYRRVLRALSHHAGLPLVDFRDADDERVAEVAAREYPVTVTTERVPFCEAYQVSDSKVCRRCDLAWDVNDDDPPRCGRWDNQEG